VISAGRGAFERFDVDGRELQAVAEGGDTDQGCLTPPAFPPNFVLKKH
jgi:hypothetical protein